MNRRSFLQASGLLMASSALGNSTLSSPVVNPNSPADDVPLMDLHVHRSDDLSITDIIAMSKKMNMPVGVIENVAPWGITNDTQLRAYIEELKPYPVFIGLQPMSPGWSENLSPDLVMQADYVAMDPQIVEKGNRYGETIFLWEYNAYIDDPDYFMEQNMKHYLHILTSGERLDVFACPLFLPCCIEREYHRLWTRERMSQIIDAAKAKGVAIEINDTAHVPHEDFILMAKRAGLKFTFGSDTRNHYFGRLDYCRRIARICQLTEADFYLPEKRR